MTNNYSLLTLVVFSYLLISKSCTERRCFYSNERNGKRCDFIQTLDDPVFCCLVLDYCTAYVPVR